MKIFSKTDIGLLRDENQDCVWSRCAVGQFLAPQFSATEWAEKCTAELRAGSLWTSYQSVSARILRST